MNKDIIIVAGSKGGVGKSVVSVGAIDTLRAQGDAPLLVESDTSNPDVFKMCQGEIPCETTDLDDANGWIDFINHCDAYRDGPAWSSTRPRATTGA